MELEASAGSAPRGASVLLVHGEASLRPGPPAAADDAGAPAAVGLPQVAPTSELDAQLTHREGQDRAVLNQQPPRLRSFLETGEGGAGSWGRLFGLKDSRRG